MTQSLGGEDHSNRKFKEVSDYYGRILESSKDLKTDACCTTDPPPPHVKEILKNIHPEITNRYYGCGLVIPAKLNHQKILDLGCGTGRDVYLLSALAGPDGFVTGVDMTEEQLEIATKNIDYQSKKFGYSRPNVDFKLGNIELLDQIGIKPSFYDIVVSNCVLNLSPQKEQVMKQVYKALKSGGEMYFSDVYSDRRIPQELRDDPVMYGECLSGALYWNDFLALAKKCGFGDPRLVEHRPLAIQNTAIKEKLGAIKFQSATYRLFKIPELEPHCEDHGQAAMYMGTTRYYPNSLIFDRDNIFDKGRVVPICGNTFRMLSESRYKNDFKLIGDFDTHFGHFAGCQIANPFDREVEKESPCC